MILPGKDLGAPKCYVLEFAANASVPRERAISALKCDRFCVYYFFFAR